MKENRSKKEKKSTQVCPHLNSESCTNFETDLSPHTTKMSIRKYFTNLWILILRQAKADLVPPFVIPVS